MTPVVLPQTYEIQLYQVYDDSWNTMWVSSQDIGYVNMIYTSFLKAAQQQKLAIRLLKVSRTVYRHSEDQEVSTGNKVVHYMRGGGTPCGMSDRLSNWPTNHNWSVGTLDVNCPECRYWLDVNYPPTSNPKEPKPHEHTTENPVSQPGSTTGEAV